MDDPVTSNYIHGPVTENSPIHPVVLAPTFNNARTVADVLRRIDLLGLPVIVINDGSTDRTEVILETWRKEHGRDARATRDVMTHPQNRGKAAALRTGFARAIERGFTHAVTIDTDGQLDPAEIPSLLDVARSSPAAMVLGCRDANAADYPKASRIGRYWANVMVRWESGARVADSQCGFRVYPLRLMEALRCRADRYGYETEVLTRAAWAGVTIEQADVRCGYVIAEGRVSHYRPWRDSLSAARMHARLLLRSALPWPTARAENAETGTMFRRFVQWISPARAWRAVRDDPVERSRFAAGLAVGVFIANLPLYGVQTLASLYAARRLRLNPLATVAGSHLSTPPIGLLLIAAAVSLGHWVLHGRPPAVKSFDPSVVGYPALFRSVLVEWTLGSIVLGAVLAGATFMVARWMLRWLPVRTPGDSGMHPAAPAPGPARASPKPAA